MINIRKAQEKDQQNILSLAKSDGLDFWYPSMPMDNFWVAEEDKEIVGMVQLKENSDFFFLSSLGVVPEKQKQGLGAQLLKEMIKKTNKNIYLYTLIPKFFKKFGFKIIDTPKFLPRPKPMCMDCFPDKCVCMIYNKSK